MIGAQDPKSECHYGNCASTETLLMTNPLESRRDGVCHPAYILHPLCAPPKTVLLKNLRD